MLPFHFSSHIHQFSCLYQMCNRMNSFFRIECNFSEPVSRILSLVSYLDVFHDYLGESAVLYCQEKLSWKRSWKNISDLPDYIYLSIYRFLHERHEQSKQDLKGLEETVVSHYLLS